MTIEELKKLIDEGEFHHATYRDFGTLWEGLRIYVKSPTGWQGYEPSGLFPKSDPNLDVAYDLVRHTGISVGAYGRG